MKYLLMMVFSILSIRSVSRAYGALTRLRRPRFLIQAIIRLFKNTYDIDMTDYVGDTDDYSSLSEFFVRPLDASKRKLKPNRSMLLSPCDGVLNSIETVYQDQGVQAKGRTYSIAAMLGEEIDFKQGWHVAVIYLAPSNYHRFHYPVSGTVNRYLHTGARLYPVNSIGLNYVDSLFVRNERIVTKMESGGYNCFFVAVGATFVGSIKMEYIHKKAPRHKWHPVAADVNQLDEMGRFEMGSTIVMVIPEKLAQPLDNLAGTTVTLGQVLFKLKN